MKKTERLGAAPVRLLITFLAIIAGCAAEKDSNSAGTQGPRYLIIDDDNGMAFDLVQIEGNYDVTALAKFTDPDGGLELLYALGDPEIEVIGLTCMMGVVSTDICLGANQKLLEAAGRTDIPYFQGATSAYDLGQPTAASDFIIDAVRRRPGEVEIAASGPMTNIATALMLDPELPRLWKALYIMSGEFGLGSNIAAAAELTNGDLNLSVDYPAADYLFTNAGPCAVFPNEIMDEVLVNAEDLEYFRQADSAIAQYLLYEITFWFDLISTSFDQDGFWPHGMTGIAAALHPEHRGQPTRSAVRVRSTGESSGKHYWGPIIAELVDDPGLPVQTIYFQFAAEDQFRDDFRDRLTR